MRRHRPGHAAPFGATWSRDATNFAVFSAHATDVELSLFREADDAVASDRIPLTREGDVWHVAVEGLAPGQLYGYRARGPYAPLLGHRFNPAKLLLDPYARALSGPVAWRPELAQPSRRPGGRGRRRGRGPARQRRRHAQMRGGRSGLRLGRRSAARDSVGPHGDLRMPREGHDDAAPGCAGGAPRDLPRALQRSDPRAPRVPARDRRRAHAGASGGGRAQAAPAGAGQLLGLLTHRLLRAGRSLRDRRRMPDRGIPPHGAAVPCGGDRSAGGRGLQPHRRGRRIRADPLVPGPRQRRVLPARPGATRALSRLHRLRQLARRAVVSRPRPRPRQPALLGRGDARGRIPLRHRDRARAPRSRVRSGGAVLRARAVRPEPRRGEADRRALGSRAARLSGRRVSAWLGGVERQVAGWRAPVLARRHRRHRRPGVAALGQQRSVRRRRSRPPRERQLRDLSRRLYPARSRELRAQAQRGQSRGQPRRHRLQPEPQLGRRRRGADHPRRAGPRARQSQPPRHAGLRAGGAHALPRGRARPHPARQQQRVLPRRAAHLGPLGPRCGPADAARVHADRVRHSRCDPGPAPDHLLPAVIRRRRRAQAGFTRTARP